MKMTTFTSTAQTGHGQTVIFGAAPKMGRAQEPCENREPTVRVGSGDWFGQAWKWLNRIAPPIQAFLAWRAAKADDPLLFSLWCFAIFCNAYFHWKPNTEGSRAP